MGTRRIKMKIKAALSIASAALALLTVVSREWIEILFGVDPDNGSGTLEWFIVVGLALTALTLGVWSRSDWRQLRAA